MGLRSLTWLCLAVCYIFIAGNTHAEEYYSIECRLRTDFKFDVDSNLRAKNCVQILVKEFGKEASGFESRFFLPPKNFEKQRSKVFHGSKASLIEILGLPPETENQHYSVQLIGPENTAMQIDGKPCAFKSLHFSHSTKQPHSFTESGNIVFGTTKKTFKVEATINCMP